MRINCSVVEYFSSKFKSPGGFRREIKLKSNLGSEVFMEPPTDSDDGSHTELVVGKENGSGLKMTVLKFDVQEYIPKRADKVKCAPG